ncbi:hypothetical protein DFH08DRAFT_863517 [Mycena albidolilacea]|uniref:Uncharacterized protein n=1 Tax=Mycena albidolilacea TaxID=1033008 RepID=A0AAD7E726_9AGAR|nr:hypothetical protein DFH08DRAFT_946430 [Mycena albidolilacea]KAJ7350081.1 hypothetical protein DFH08DRAFT_863517 [Mycena albidolilacea]
MHFAAKNYLRIIVSIAALARAIVVYGAPIVNTAPAVEEVTARDEIYGSPDRMAEDRVKARWIWGWPYYSEGEAIE